MTDIFTEGAVPPRRNGELAFDEPWQRRAFGLAEAVVREHLAGDHEPFRQRLIAAITAEPERPYWESWAVALEQFLVDTALVTVHEIDTAAAIDD